MQSARERAGINFIETDKSGRTLIKFPWAPPYINYSQPKQEDEKRLGHDIRFQLTENIEGVKNYLIGWYKLINSSRTLNCILCSRDTVLAGTINPATKNLYWKSWIRWIPYIINPRLTIRELIWSTLPNASFARKLFRYLNFNNTWLIANFYA